VARIRSLPILAIRRMVANWRLLASVALGALVSSAILSATAIYADAIRDLGLQHALEHPTGMVDITTTREAATARLDAYGQSNERQDRALRAAVGDALGDVIRQGTSQTFYLTPAGERSDEADQNRPRAVLRFRDRIEQHLDVTAGRLAPGGSAGSGRTPVALSAEIAARTGAKLGDRFDLHAWWDSQRGPLPVEVVGIVQPADPEDPYWGTAEVIEEPRTSSWETYVLLLPADAFFATLTTNMPSASAVYADRYAVIPDGIDARRAATVADAVDGLPQVMANVERNARVETDLSSILRGFDDRLFFVRIPLFVLLLQIGGIVAYYLVMVSTMLVERQAPEMAVLRSRGASPLQLLLQFGVEGFLLAAGAAAAGPWLAAAVISALGPTPPFSALSGGGPLDVHVSTLAYVFAGAGALLALGAFMLPAWRATRTTVVEFRRSSARPRPTPLFLRYYLDVAMVLLLAVLFWRLRQDEQLFTRTLFGDRQSDPLLLATPTVLMITVGVVFLRLFPLALRLLAWGIGRLAGAAALVGMRSLARDPTHYARLVLMLMLATGVGMFGATFSATLARSYDDRARYPVGADVRAADFRGLVDVGDAAFTRKVAEAPADAVSPVMRIEASLLASGKNESVELLGINPDTFTDVAYFRTDFAPDSMHGIASALDANRAAAPAAALPADTRQAGVWAKFPDIRGPVALFLGLQDGDGRRMSIQLGIVRPGDAATREWRFFAGNLERPRLGNQPPQQRPLAPPYTLTSLEISTQSAITAQRGVVLLGPLLTSAAASTVVPAQGVEPEAFITPFAGAKVAFEFAGPEFEVIQGQRAARTTDTLRADTDAPAGAEASARYEWQDSRVAPRDRGIRPRTDGEPLLLYLARESAERLGLAPGATFQVLVGGTYQDARLGGTFALFPTYNPDDPSRAGFAVADASRLAATVNSSLPTRAVAYNEAWYRTDDPGETRDSLAPLQPEVLLDTASERARAREDPLIAAGWAGILGISFATVLILSAIGFVLYSYLTAQRRALEFAILRTLGFSRVQVFLVVALEYFVIVVAGMGLGTAVGLQVGERMMDVFSVSEQGTAVLPPFSLAVSWASVVTVWTVLGFAFVLTIGAVVLLYVRLAIHRALRVGEA
jgi:putative ABC transport system permease protein